MTETEQGANTIYEEINKEKYPDIVMERIKSVLNIMRPFFNEGITSDVCCGSKEIGEIMNADNFYDFYKIDDSVKFINMMKKGNNVEKSDNVIFFHSLEHFPDVLKTLSILRDEFLKEGGRLFIAAPNALYDTDHQPYNNSIGHYAYLTLEYVKMIANKLGFRVLLACEFNVYKNSEELIMILEKQ